MKFKLLHRVYVPIVFVLIVFAFIHSKFLNPKQNTNEDYNKEMTVGSDKVPSEEEWKLIKKGLSQEEVEKILGKSNHVINYEDSDVWKYCKNKLKIPEELALFMLPFGDVYSICFDENKNVIKKEYEFVSKEKALKLLEDAEKIDN